MPTVKYTPPWAAYEKDLRSDDAAVAIKATEAFDETRKQELKTSAKARKFEKARKQEWADAKPEWARKRQAKQAAPLQAMLTGLKQGGTFKTRFKKVMPGFVLVQLDPLPETTDCGIVLDTTTSPVDHNTGVILQIGDQLTTLHTTVQPPATRGDHVMFKKGLPGLQLQVQGEACLLMTWDDLLGVLDA